MFTIIQSIADIQAAVASVKEIRFTQQSNGITIACYQFMDSRTFDLPQAIECRGIAFDDLGQVVSRPLHKFFNLGEKSWLTMEHLIQQQAQGKIAAIFEKVDGSMIASSWINGDLCWRSKKSFSSDVVKLANQYMALPENAHLLEFSKLAASQQLTVIFEITHPLARIVVAQNEPKMQLLHVRNNLTGEYVLLDPHHEIHSMVRKFNVPAVHRFTDLSLHQMIESLETMKHQEGYIIQFTDGDMVKVKCPWYLRLHRSITFLRERDIAVLSLNSELDDVKQALTEAGIDLLAVNAVETRLKNILNNFSDEIEKVHGQDHALDRKTFAMKHSKHQLFGLMMARYSGKEYSIGEWYQKNLLKQDFGLLVLADGALADAISG